MSDIEPPTLLIRITELDKKYYIKFWFLIILSLSLLVFGFVYIISLATSLDSKLEKYYPENSTLQYHEDQDYIGNVRVSYPDFYTYPHNMFIGNVVPNTISNNPADTNIYSNYRSYCALPLD